MPFWKYVNDIPDEERKPNAYFYTFWTKQTDKNWVSYMIFMHCWTTTFKFSPELYTPVAHIFRFHLLFLDGAFNSGTIYQIWTIIFFYSTLDSMRWSYFDWLFMRLQPKIMNIFTFFPIWNHFFGIVEFISFFSSLFRFDVPFHRFFFFISIMKSLCHQISSV